MVGVGNAATFHMQEKSLGVFQQNAQRFVGHLGQGGFASGVVGAVSFVLNMRRLE